MANLYCGERDVVMLLGQAGVDLRQDDPPGLSGLYTATSTSATFTQPAVGATVSVSVFNGLWPAVGGTVYVGTAGYYLVTAVGAGNLTLQNTGSPLNAQPGALIASGVGVGASPLSDFIERASLEIDEHCAQFYNQSILPTSLWVTKECSIVAAYLFCARRGNPPPPGVAMLYERTKTKLEQISKGRFNIPLLPKSKATVPVMSNMRPALRPHPHAVVERQRSTGTPQNYQQNRDPWDLTGINDAWVYNWSI